MPPPTPTTRTPPPTGSHPPATPWDVRTHPARTRRTPGGTSGPPPVWAPRPPGLPRRDQPATRERPDRPARDPPRPARPDGRSPRAAVRAESGRPELAASGPDASGHGQNGTAPIRARRGRRERQGRQGPRTSSTHRRVGRGPPGSAVARRGPATGAKGTSDAYPHAERSRRPQGCRGRSGVDASAPTQGCGRPPRRVDRPLNDSAWRSIAKRERRNGQASAGRGDHHA